MVTRVKKLIGKTFQNRDIFVYEFMVEKPKINCIITGSVHGTEYWCSQSCELLMNDIEANPNFYNDMSIAIIPWWNADGVANNTYGNAQNYQINFSCLNVATKEQRALHEYIENNKFYPDFFIDNHNLDHWQRGHGDFLYDHVPRLSLLEDLVIGINMSSLQRHKMGWAEFTDLVNHVQTKAGSNYKIDKFDEHNTVGNLFWNTHYSISSTQQWLATRYDALTFLIEGVLANEQYTFPGNSTHNPMREAQFLAMKYMMDWSRNHPQLCNNTKSVAPAVGEYVPFDETVIWHLSPYKFTARNDNTGQPHTEYANFSRFLWTPNVKHPADEGITLSREWTTAPLAYAVHQDNEENLNTYLSYLGFKWVQGVTGDSFDTEQFHCTDVDPWDDQGGDLPMQFPQQNMDGFYTSATRSDFSDYHIYYVDQMGGLVLVHILEPMSNMNMSAYQTLFPSLEVVPDDDFPIIRLISRN